MKKFIGFLALAFLPFFAAAQEFTLNYEGCPDATEAVAQVTSLPFFGRSSDDLQSYFSEKMQPILENQSPTGEMNLMFIIDKDGMPCLHTFHSEGEVRIEPNHIKNIVDGMEGWQPAMQGDQPVPYGAKINLRFKGEKVVARMAK